MFIIGEFVEMKWKRGKRRNSCKSPKWKKEIFPCKVGWLGRGGGRPPHELWVPSYLTLIYGANISGKRCRKVVLRISLKSFPIFSSCAFLPHANKFTSTLLRPNKKGQEREIGIEIENSKIHSFLYIFVLNCQQNY